LKNISARGKIADVVNFIDDTLEQGEKVVLFVHLKEVALAFKEHYRQAVTITGSDDLKERQNSISKFKNDSKCNLIICSIKAAGTGVDGLQHASSTVMFIEQPWTSADCDQAEDRLNRIGQTKPVQALYFLGKDTIDTHIYDIIQTKRSIADAITGNTDEVKIDFVDAFANLFNQKK
jgi:SWI/SNF-related matrix-associated actin-dependent regulator 1 of chromatin subfamily A